MKRLLSLDIFRGFIIVNMLITNNPGSYDHVFAPFEHTDWIGWSFADLIFPAFLFIAGVAITLSKHSSSFKHILWRALLLFIAGIFLNCFPACSNIRILGILQRIAICYVICNLIFHYGKSNSKFIWHLLLYYISFILIYWLLIETVPVPGYGTGILNQEEGSLSWYIDSRLLHGHTWIGSKAQGFDPEGIISTLPSISNMLLGVITGQFLKSEHKRNIYWMWLAGTILIILGLITSDLIPIIRNLWTPSFAIFTSGTSLLLFALFYGIIDIKDNKNLIKYLEPLRIFGINSLSIFIISVATNNLLHYFWIKQCLYTYLFLKYLINPTLASFIYAIFFMFFMYFIALTLTKRKNTTVH